MVDKYSSDEQFNIEDEDGCIPQMMICKSETINSYGDEWDENYWYPINFCPYCGEPIEIKVIKTEDKNLVYSTLSEQRELLWKQCKETDSRKEASELHNKVHKLDDMIENLYTLAEYKEENKKVS